MEQDSRGSTSSGEYPARPSTASQYQDAKDHVSLNMGDNEANTIPLDRRSSPVSPSGQLPPSPQLGFAADPYQFVPEFVDSHTINVSRLKQTVATSAILAGFAMVALVELSFDDGLPEPILIVYAIVASLLVSINLFSLLVSVCLLPTLETYNAFLRKNQSKGLSTFLSHNLSPHRRFRRYMAIAWIFSTSLGTVVFLLDVVVVAWTRFYMEYKVAAWAVTILVIPVIGVFLLFSIRFHSHVASLQLRMHRQALNIAVSGPRQHHL